MSIAAIGIELAERGLLPDALLRAGIRRLCANRLTQCVPASEQARSVARKQFADDMRRGPIAPVPEAANEQHYEVPEAFFGLALGHLRKYSGCYWPKGCTSLDQAEDAALEQTCDHAGLADGMDILELGCGWGSLTLWMGERYPGARITAVSNSNSQREHIMSQAKERGLGNIEVITCDMNDFETDDRFDRVVSVEMFEHMRNYERLLQRVASWLKPSGKLFIHIFAHKHAAYPFETEGAGNWMGRHFFTGGIMPARELLHEFDRDLAVAQEWVWDGTHYEKTSEAWLLNLDRQKTEVIRLFAESMPLPEARRMYHRWRIFFLACAECFGYDHGQQWIVAHYLLEPQPQTLDEADLRAEPVENAV